MWCGVVEALWYGVGFAGLAGSAGSGTRVRGRGSRGLRAGSRGSGSGGGERSRPRQRAWRRARIRSLAPGTDPRLGAGHGSKTWRRARIRGLAPGTDPGVWRSWLATSGNRDKRWSRAGAAKARTGGSRRSRWGVRFRLDSPHVPLSPLAPLSRHSPLSRHGPLKVHQIHWRLGVVVPAPTDRSTTSRRWDAVVPRQCRTAFHGRPRRVSRPDDPRTDLLTCRPTDLPTCRPVDLRSCRPAGPVDLPTCRSCRSVQFRETASALRAAVLRRLRAEHGTAAVVA